jgi:hypothetical protein
MDALGSSYEQTILAWNAHEEFAFRVDACSLPGMRSLAERWGMRALGNDSTELNWTLAADPSRLSPVVHAAWSMVTRVVMGIAAPRLPRYLRADRDGPEQ